MLHKDNCPVGSFYINITGYAAAFPIGYVPHGNKHLTGYGVFTFPNDKNQNGGGGGGGMDWSMQLTNDGDHHHHQYAVTQAHLYNLPLVPEGDSWACWGGRWSDHEYMSGGNFNTLYGITADDIAKDTWVIMVHTEGGHFAVDDTGHLIVYDQNRHETSVTGITESGERFNNRVPRKLTNRLLREYNPVSGKWGDKDFDAEFPDPQHFAREQEQPFPDANDNVWIVWDTAAERYIPSPYGASRNLTNDDIDNVEYLFYLYDDQGPEWDWGGPEGAGGGVLIPCPEPPPEAVTTAPVATDPNTDAPVKVVAAPPVTTPTTIEPAVVAVAPTNPPVTLAPAMMIDVSLIDSPVESVTNKKKSDKKGQSERSERSL